MKWSYKTIHFALKKEGLLGAGFLDESEIEQALNEYGRSGWELVSVLEVQDGIIAIFKQPLGPVAPIEKKQVDSVEEMAGDELPEERDYSGYDNDPEVELPESPTDESTPNNTIGAIRIE